MLGFVFVDDVESTLAADNFIIWTNLLYTCTHFHADHLLNVSDDTLLIFDKLLITVGYPTLRKIVRRQFYLDRISRD